MDTRRGTGSCSRAVGLGIAAFAMLGVAGGCLTPDKAGMGEDDAKGTIDASDDTGGKVDVSGGGDDVTPGACITASDCKGLAHPDCEGTWACEAAACVWHCDVTPTTCVSDDDCVEGAQCVEGECQPVSPPQCGPGAECPPNAVCEDGVCVEVTPSGCQSDADCQEGYLCELAPCAAPCDCGPSDSDCACEPCLGAGTCVAKQPPVGECTYDDQCGPGERCNAAEVCLPGPGSGGGGGGAEMPAICWGECVPDTNEPECYVSSDCGVGYLCDTSCGGDGQKMIPPSDGGDGIVACPGQCVPDPNANTCSSDFDCKEGYTCAWVSCFAMPGEDPAPPPCPGMCVPAQPTGECTSDLECGPDQFCAFYACTDCACPDNEPCDCEAGCWGYCKAKDPVVVCLEDGDCPKGSSCQCVYDPTCVECDGCLNQCVPDAPMGCTSDDQCADGEICVIGLCPPCLPDEPCPPCTGSCQPDWSGGQCNTDADCAEGSSCQCMPDPNCPACAVCVFQCVPDAPQGCTSDAECGDGAFCDMSACGAWFIPCDPATGCGGCEGVCTPKETPKACTWNGECAPGQKCEFTEPCTDDGICHGQCVDTQPGECVVSGCSGEICAAEAMDSPCVYQAWYECLQYAQCGTTADGSCGWVGDELFEQCMIEKKGGAF